jgi:hypothetical protein
MSTHSNFCMIFQEERPRSKDLYTPEKGEEENIVEA